MAEDPREVLLSVTRKLTERLRWLERGGVTAVPRGERTAPKARVKSAVAGAVVPEPEVRATPARAMDVAPVAVAPSVADGRGAARLAEVRAGLGDCTRCKLSGGRQHLVFGTGNPDAALCFVGEAPGADEDRSGEPFVGPAGQLLTKMIEAMGFHREDIYICNIIKCRPPGNRNPEPDEIASCEPFLKAQLAAIRPRMIVCLGKFAAQTLLRSDAPISRMRGRFQAYEGIPLMPTFHPAFLLRNPAAKREVWADLQLVMSELDRLSIPRPRGK